VYVSTWTPFGGQQPTVVLDQVALDHAGTVSGAFSHALQTPADGTLLMGLPSARVFRVSSGIATWLSSWTASGSQPTVAINDADLDYAGSGIARQHLISATPISILDGLPATTRATRLTVSWTRPVLASALSSFDVRVQSAALPAAFTPWQSPAGWTALTGTSIGSPSLVVGRTYCFSVRAHNLAAQTGPWSTQCTTRR
jgi:hypothetical protein